MSVEPVYLGRQLVGHIREDLTFVKHVQGSRHRFRKAPGPGWAIDLQLLKDLKAKEVWRIQIIDDETWVRYTTSMQKFGTMGRPIEFGGHGKQLCLNLKYWTTDQLELTDSGTVVKDLI